MTCVVLNKPRFKNFLDPAYIGFVVHVLLARSRLFLRMVVGVKAKYWSVLPLIFAAQFACLCCTIVGFLRLLFDIWTLFITFIWFSI